MRLRFVTAAVLALTATVAVRLDANLRPAPVPHPPQVAPIAVQEAPTPAAEERMIRFEPFSLDIAAAARAYVDHRPRGFRDDCSGFVSAVFTKAGIPMDGRVADIYATAEKHRLVHHNPVPVIGDVAFFDNTHDRNGNGQWDDDRTHIAVVVDVEPDGTIVMAHKGSKRALIRMNLLQPHLAKDEDGNVLNSYLRRYGKNDTWSVYLTGQLWSGFASIDPARDWSTP